MVHEIESFFPIWEERFSKSNPPPEGDTWRSLLRPVYWLGNWQFACLDYFHPPLGLEYRCVDAEPFPPFMQKLVDQIEAMTRKMGGSEVPKDWKLNTCLINYYGSKIDNGSEVDMARVGDHKDSEPGPVASISLGERAFFQFVKGRPTDPRNVVMEQWLGDGSLLIFWSKKFKEELFHRVQRVENKTKVLFNDHLDDYKTRRINLTFRYVPDQYIFPLSKMPNEKREDINIYVDKLAEKSEFWRAQK
ncbi:oxidoreductase, 2OG-Fe(II) oxygenase family protein [Bacteriovorax sp. Seq25_V]|nr:oxidoreductase, 2OG-Fe(II) oxygenase family protein [Bacteriovorax sp. Seq25_V]